MRRFLILILLLASPVALHAASYEARSPLHAIALDVVPLGAVDVEYDVTISDVATGRLLGSPKLRAKRGETASWQIDIQGTHIAVRVAEGKRLMASVEFERGTEIVDAIQAFWTHGPQQTITTSVDSPVRVGGDVKAPVVIHRVEAAYTEEARKAGISGVIIMEVVVGRDGLVKKAEVLKPLRFGLDQAAIDAVKQWRFRPGTLNGQPVDVLYNLTVNFRSDKQTSVPPG
jgi:TonB family protein